MASDPIAEPLDPALLELIGPSAGRLAQSQNAFTRLLHADLITMAPDLGTDGWTFCDRMVRAVLWTVTSDRDPQVIADGMRWLGATNWREGFAADQYVSVAHALVRAVQELSGSDWSASLGSAWIGLFLWLEPYIILGAREAAQEEADRLAYQEQSQGAVPPARDGETAGHMLDDRPTRVRVDWAGGRTVRHQ